MDGRFDVTRAGSLFGAAGLSENGLMQDIYFSGTAPDDENVYRLAAVCGGRYVLIGVPVPDKNGVLTLSKSFSKASLIDLGFDSPNSFELVLPGENFDGSVNVNYVQNNIVENIAEMQSYEEQKSIDKEPEPKYVEKTVMPENVNAVIEEKPLTKAQQNDNIQHHNMQNQNPWMRNQQRPNQMQKPINTQKQPEKQVAVDAIKQPDQQVLAEKIKELEQYEKPVINSAPENKQGNWRPVANPSVMFAENGALSTADDIRGALIHEDGEIVYLAIPLSEGEPFPLMSAFCLGEPQTIGNDDYLVFKLKNGAFTA